MSTNLNKPAPSSVDEAPHVPHGERKTVETLLADDCRWPFGDPLSGDFYFCGKRKKDGSPYCDFHVRQAFQPAKPRAVVYRPHAA
jgi:GcrA cell cycle regulator